ncbi:MAG: hypothetical protein ACE5KZ_10320 [Candidatus Scalinduaceae bacterium]
MKILFSGYHNPNFITITEYIERAILKQGHELETYDYRSFIIPGRIREKVQFLDQCILKELNYLKRLQNLIWASGVLDGRNSILILP